MKDISTHDEQLLHFVSLVQSLKQWFEEREISIGYTDTYLGHLALLIQRKEQDARQKEREHLIQAIDELIDHEIVSESEYQKDAGKKYNPRSYGRGFSAGFVASLKLVKESLEEDEVE